VAALAAGALGLGGCEAIGKLGAMVGLGGDEPAPAPAPSPAPRRQGPRPQAAVANAGSSTEVALATPAARQAAASPAPAVTGSPVPGGTTPAPAATGASPGAGAPPPGGSAPSVPRLPGIADAYDPTGKRDPFRPYVTAAALAEQRQRLRLTPLQAVELSQLRLVAIAWGLKSNYAMVEDPGGTGYVLRVGTKVGPNGGRVSRITPEAVYVDESFRDTAGATLTNQIMLRLPQPAGGRGS
jgi:type IV pilus assembly protein PilP